MANQRRASEREERERRRQQICSAAHGCPCRDASSWASARMSSTFSRSRRCSSRPRDAPTWSSPIPAGEEMRERVPAPLRGHSQRPTGARARACSTITTRGGGRTIADALPARQHHRWLAGWRGPGRLRPPRRRRRPGRLPRTVFRRQLARDRRFQPSTAFVDVST